MAYFFRSKAAIAFTARSPAGGGQERSVADPLRHAADAPAGRRAQRAPDSGRHAAHRSAAGDGGRGGAAGGRHLCVLRPRDRPRLPADRGLPPPLRTAARLGHAHRAAAGALRRGVRPQAGRRQNRAAAAGLPFHRFPETGSQVRFPTPPRSSSRSTARSCAAATCCSTRRR